MINQLKLFTVLFFFMWSAVPSMLPLHAYEADTPFWSRIRLHGSCFIKQDTYKVRISGMKPSDRSNELQLNTLVGPSRDVGLYHIRWRHAPSIYFNRDRKDSDRFEQADNSEQILCFTGNGISICAQLFLSMDFRKLRISTGAGIKCSFVKDMVGKLCEDTQIEGAIQDEVGIPQSFGYTPQKSHYFSWSPLLLLGYKIIDNNHYTLLIDGTFAPCMYRYAELGMTHNWAYAFNFDVGSTWEKKISRYINWSVRIAYGFCMNNEIAESEADINLLDIPIISHSISGPLLQVGMSIHLLALSKCPITACATRLDHKHNGKTYRGDSFFTPYPY
ncbi:hypothetical protein [Cardinium endosymbiont of Tipula unca]|uniref:hypothetical protein n=1 Tax=Cardinium endosymbiont of Tipula unca TaxID=3066216 RepID=UPI0030D4529B